MRSGIAIEELSDDVRPQDDLFRYVNGRWLDEHVIPPDRARDGEFIRLHEEAQADIRALIEEAVSDADDDPDRRKVGDLYASFIDEAAVETRGGAPLLPLLERIAAVRDTDGLIRLLGELERDGITGPFGVYVNTDDRNAERYIVNVVQAGLGLPDESYYRDDRYAAIRTAYVDHARTMLDHAGWHDPAGAAMRIMDFETSLAAAHWDRVRLRDREAGYNLRTLAELQALAPRFDWVSWAAAAGVDADVVLAEVIVRQPDYLSAMSAALDEVDLATWKDWLAWHVVHAMAPYLSSVFVSENFAFYGRTLSGTPELRERWKRGVSLVDGAIGEAVGRLYVERHFPPAAKQRMDTLVANLIEAYRQEITTLTWMSDDTKQRALDKLDLFRPKIGYPDTWRDYSTLEIDRNDLVGNVRRAAAFEFRRHLDKIGKPIDRDEWFMTPQTVNAYYNPSMNEIVFPAAILQPPFFDPEVDDAVNYGGIGAVIGHEIGHGFDDQGSRYDGKGELHNWWTDADRAEFELRTKALIEQYDAYEPLSGHHVNGALTVGENIGDLGGLTIAYHAYLLSLGDQEAPLLDGFTGQQRVFLGWAKIWRGKSRPEEAIRLLAIDPHCPPEFRCNGPVRNLHEFYEAFGVSEGDALYQPEDGRVRIW